MMIKDKSPIFSKNSQVYVSFHHPKSGYIKGNAKITSVSPNGFYTVEMKAGNKFVVLEHSIKPIENS